MDYQLGINPDWCVFPNRKRTTLKATLFVFISAIREGGSFLFYFLQEVTWEIFFSLSVINPLVPPASPSQDVRRLLRKTFIYLVPSLVYLPPPRLFAWLCMLSWLTVWMAGFLSHWTLTGSSLIHCVSIAEAGLERDSRIAQALESGISARFLSLSVLEDC